MLSFVLKFKKTAVISISLLTAVFVLALSDGVREGIRQGLLLCVDSVIPSLFIFTAVAMFLSYSGAADIIGKLISPVTRFIFGLTGAGAVNFLLSTVSGYPVGARLIDTQFVNGTLSRAKALKAITFSVNAGPAFIVIAVGKGMLGSASDGQRLLCAHLLATFILALTVRFLPDRIFSVDCRQSASLHSPPTVATASEAFVLSVSNAAETMLNISAFVVFFSGVGGMLETVWHNNIIRSLLEVTVGVQQCTRSQLPFVAFLLGFGGVSVIFQVRAAARHVAPPLWLIVLSRLLHGTISAGIILLWEIIWPRSVSTGSFNVAGSAAVHTNPLAAVALLLLCAVLLYFTHSVTPSKK